jgi:hypothetical protein
VEVPRAPGDPLDGARPPTPARRPQRAPRSPPSASDGIATLDVGSAEHFTLVGKSQSGKTELAKACIKPVNSYVVIYTKGAGEWDERWGVVTPDPDAILYEPRVIWTPPPLVVRRPDPLHKDAYSRGLRNIFEQRGDPTGRPSVTVVFDEGKWQIPAEPNEYAMLLVHQGMGKGIGVWTLSQGVYGIFTPCLSDAKVIAAFRIQNKSHRSKLANDAQVDAEELAGLEQYEFMVYREGWPGFRGPAKLDKNQLLR